MKKDLHPEYNTVTVKLADGTEYQTRSTMSTDTYTSEVDSTNHPFYTGKQHILQTAKQVDKFRQRYGK